MVSHKNRWDVFKTSIFSIMSEAALKNDAINLAQGFPNFSAPQVVKKAAAAAILNDFNQYAPAPGLRELRLGLAARQEKTSGLRFDPDQEITVFSGATEAIFCTLLALLAPGDEIIAFQPFYDSYPAAAFAAGAKLVAVSLHAPDWRVDRKEFISKISSQTKAILLNTPHNPTGKVFSKADLEWIAGVAQAHNLTMITDEVYEEIVFAPAKHHFLASFPNMRERTVTISSTSKTFSATGWKVGYAFASPHFTKPMRTVHQFSVFCSATPLQWGMVEALKMPGSYYEEFRAEYLQRRDVLLDVLRNTGFRPSVSEGSYFILADYSKHSDLGDTDFALELCKKAKVAAIPISVFYADEEAAKRSLRYLRFAFCKDLKTFERAGENLHAAGFR